jgi:hypothetical protein
MAREEAGRRNLPEAGSGAEACTAAVGRTKPEAPRLMEAAVERKFLGYSMTWHKKPKLKIAQPSRERLAEKIRKTMRETRGGSLKQPIERLNPIFRAGSRTSG